jgi:hypothetical protein
MKTFNAHHGREGAQSLKHMLVLQNVVADKLPDDGTLIPRLVGGDTGYEVCSVICFTVVENTRHYALNCTTRMHSAGKHNKRNHYTPAHRARKHTLYDIPPIRSVFQVTQTDPRSSLMMADHCRNMKESVK